MYTKNIPFYIFIWYILAEFVPIFLLETNSATNIFIRFGIMLLVFLYFDEFLKDRIKKMKEKNKKAN